MTRISGIAPSIYYKIVSEFGWMIDGYTRSLRGAKSIATKALTFGCGTMTLEFQGNHFKREFWQNLNRFGWGPWIEV